MEQIEARGILLDVHHPSTEAQKQSHEMVKAHLNKVFAATLKQNGQQALHMVTCHCQVVSIELRIGSSVLIWVSN